MKEDLLDLEITNGLWKDRGAWRDRNHVAVPRQCWEGAIMTTMMNKTPSEIL